MAKDKQEFGEEFNFLVRIENTDLDGKRTVVNALTGLKGVNSRLSRVIAAEAGVEKRELMGNLPPEEIQKIVSTLDRIDEFTPSWMRNRRMDPESGDDKHIIGSEIDLQLRDDLNRLKKIRSWRGVRHENNLPVRGQRTKANGRKGATVGVQRKKK
ncbi:MAG: 30S ribosomal protein S13 [Thermoplasmatota archaeon]